MKLPLKKRLSLASALTNSEDLARIARESERSFNVLSRVMENPFTSPQTLTEVWARADDNMKNCLTTPLCKHPETPLDLVQKAIAHRPDQEEHLRVITALHNLTLAEWEEWLVVPSDTQIVKYYLMIGLGKNIPKERRSLYARVLAKNPKAVAMVRAWLPDAKRNHAPFLREILSAAP